MEPLLTTSTLQIYKLASKADSTDLIVPSSTFLNKGSRIEYELVKGMVSRSEDLLGFTRIRYTLAGRKYIGYVPESMIHAQVREAKIRNRESAESSQFVNFKKKIKFLVSLAYNRLMYPTWNEIFIFDDISNAARSLEKDSGVSTNQIADHGGTSQRSSWPRQKVSTHIILGQLPTAEHMQTLQRDFNVTCVLSCVESFELRKYNLNFSEMNLVDCVLAQEDFGRIQPDLIRRGVDFLMQQNLGTRRKAYVHCKAGRGRSGAVVMAYLVVHAMMRQERERSRLLLSEEKKKTKNRSGGGGSKDDIDQNSTGSTSLSDGIQPLAAQALAAQQQSKPRSEIEIVPLNLLDAFLHMYRSRGHVSYKEKKMRDLHIFFLQQLSSQQIVLLPNVEAELWIDRATEAVMKSITAFKKWRKEMDLANATLKSDKDQNTQELSWFAPISNRLSHNVQQKIKRLKMAYTSYRSQYCKLCSFEYFCVSTRASLRVRAKAIASRSASHAKTAAPPVSVSASTTNASSSGGHSSLLNGSYTSLADAQREMFEQDLLRQQLGLREDNKNQ